MSIFDLYFEFHQSEIVFFEFPLFFICALLCKLQYGTHRYFGGFEKNSSKCFSPIKYAGCVSVMDLRLVLRQGIAFPVGIKYIST